jgi:hypothetical protein
MTKIVRLTESDLNRLVKKVISEQQGEGKFTGGGMGPGGVKAKTSSYTVNMDGSLFQNGIDKIDTNSDAFNKGINAISNAISQTSISGGGKPTIKIIGGASAVGQKQGYDNSSLAKRRSNNFYNIVKDRFPNVNFIMGNPIVGVATEKNSPQANSEQFVKLVVSGTKTNLSIKQAIDHTTAKINDAAHKAKQDPPKPIEYTTYVTVCYKVPVAYYNTILSPFKKWEVSKS